MWQNIVAIYMHTCMQRHSIPSGGSEGGDGVGATGALELALPVGS